MKFAHQLAARQQFASAVANLNLSQHHHRQQQQQQQALEANGNGLTAAVALANSAQRSHVHGGASDMSPLKTVASQAVANQLNQHLLNLQQLQQQQQVLSDEDDELDEFADEHPQQASSAAGHFYESLQALNQRQQHLGQGAAQTQPQPQHQASGSSTSNNDNQQQSSAFLMDKNKKLFPQKLWELIHNPNIQHCLRWSQDGQRVYLNRTEFEQYYLKTPNNQFHTQKAISFVRQMNMYGFRKVDDCYYENDNFRRDRKQLLKNMIRRHPNKGLFVGLVDHHQLAAAAAAQQALQVNQQLQQLENQHKQRAEQALRLNNYLNQQHQQQHPAFQTNFALAQAAAAASMNQSQCQNQHQNQMKPQQQHAHSSPFEQMSASQLVAAQVAAASHYSHQSIGQSLAQQQQVGENLTISSNNNNINNNNINNNQATTTTSISPAPATAAAGQDNLKLQQQAKTGQQHQPKKSRLLSNFYASQQQQQVQETNQTDGSSKSPQLPSLREAKFGGLASVPTLSSQAAQAQVAVDAQARQAALHETLVRSLLQLKQSNHMSPHHQELVAALTQQQQPHQLHQAQQQQQRTLLESLASLSSAGTGSIVDPASNSPTERTATPPSGPPSPHHHHGYSSSSCDVGMALDLATSAAKSRSGRRHHDGQEGAWSQEEEDGDGEGDEDDEDDDEYAIEVDDDGEHANHTANMGRTSQVDSEMAASPLDGTKKVRKFLEDQMARVVSDELAEQMHDDEVESKLCCAIKREVDDDLDECREPRDQVRKKAKLIMKENNQEAAEKQLQDPSSISRRLVSEICSRRGDQLNEFALDEAAKYAQCFLGILIDDASLIASHANVEASEAAKDCDESRVNKKPSDEGEHEDKQAPPSSCSSSAASSSSASSSSSSAASSTQRPIDVSSLSLALKLIPAKLLAAIQQQANGDRVGTNSSERQVANLSTETATETPSVDRQASACERQQQQVAVDS